MEALVATALSQAAADKGAAALAALRALLRNGGGALAVDAVAEGLTGALGRVKDAAPRAALFSALACAADAPDATACAPRALELCAAECFGVGGDEPRAAAVAALAAWVAAGQPLAPNVASAVGACLDRGGESVRRSALSSLLRMRPSALPPPLSAALAAIVHTARAAHRWEGAAASAALCRAGALGGARDPALSLLEPLASASRDASTGEAEAALSLSSQLLDAAAASPASGSSAWVGHAARVLVAFATRRHDAASRAACDATAQLFARRPSAPGGGCVGDALRAAFSAALRADPGLRGAQQARRLLVALAGAPDGAAGNGVGQLCVLCVTAGFPRLWPSLASAAAAAAPGDTEALLTPAGAAPLVAALSSAVAAERAAGEGALRLLSARSPRALPALVPLLLDTLRSPPLMPSDAAVAVFFCPPHLTVAEAADLANRPPVPIAARGSRARAARRPSGDSDSDDDDGEQAKAAARAAPPPPRPGKPAKADPREAARAAALAAEAGVRAEVEALRCAQASALRGVAALVSGRTDAQARAAPCTDAFEASDAFVSCVDAVLPLLASPLVGRGEAAAACYALCDHVCAPQQAAAGCAPLRGVPGLGGAPFASALVAAMSAPAAGAALHAQPGVGHTLSRLVAAGRLSRGAFALAFHLASAVLRAPPSAAARDAMALLAHHAGQPPFPATAAAVAAALGADPTAAAAALPVLRAAAAAMGADGQLCEEEAEAVTCGLLSGGVACRATCVDALSSLAQPAGLAAFPGAAARLLLAEADEDAAVREAAASFLGAHPSLRAAGSQPQALLQYTSHALQRVRVATATAVAAVGAAQPAAVQPLLARLFGVGAARPADDIPANPAARAAAMLALRLLVPSLTPRDLPLVRAIMFQGLCLNALTCASHHRWPPSSPAHSGRAAPRCRAARTRLASRWWRRTARRTRPSSGRCCKACWTRPPPRTRRTRRRPAWWYGSPCWPAFCRPAIRRCATCCPAWWACCPPRRRRCSARWRTASRPSCRRCRRRSAGRCSPSCWPR